MIVVRKSEQRGYADHGWLKSKHTFSFADYHDPKQMGFGVLRVINEDRIDGGSGFSTHPHRDMEIISYVIGGALEHKDSMGNSTVIHPGEVQRMSAGTGVRHSEFNHFQDKETHFLQIWILPEKLGIAPGYEQKSFQSAFEKETLTLVASKQGTEDSISLNQDVNMYVLKSKVAGKSNFNTASGRKIWIQVLEGSLRVENVQMSSGDGTAISDLKLIPLQWSEKTHFILFDLP